MIEDMTRGEILKTMRDAGFPIYWVPLSTARAIVSGETDYVGCFQVTGPYLDGVPQNRRSAEYRCDEPVVTAFDLGDVASTCEYSRASTTEANNLACLLRDFPNRIFTHGYSNGQTGMVLLASLDTDLCAILTYLKEEYPSYDDTALSEYESDLAWQAWDQWLGSDIRSTLQSALEQAFDDYVDLDDLVTDEQLRSLFLERSGEASPRYATWEDSDGVRRRHDMREAAQYVGETGYPDSVTFPDREEITQRMADWVVDLKIWRDAQPVPRQRRPLDDAVTESSGSPS